MNMVEFVLYIRYNREVFFGYRELVNTLKKIPDVTVFVEWTGYTSVSIYEVDGKQWKPLYAEVIYMTPSVKVYFDNKLLYDINAKDDREAISLIDLYIRYLLAKITHNTDYFATRVAKDDLTQLTILDSSVYRANGGEDAINLGRMIAEIYEDEFLEAYHFFIRYKYPYMYRKVWGYVICCRERWFIIIEEESERGKFPGSNNIIVKPNGRLCDYDTVIEVLKEKAREIEENILKINR